jgi:hypothetical protein
MSWLDELLLPGGLWAWPGESESTCVREADAKTAPLFEKRQQVRNNWNPTGTYTPGDLERIVDAAFEMMLRAGTQVIDKALADAQLPSGRDQLHAARQAIFDQEAKQTQYRTAIADARARGISQINAPGLKRFVLGAMEVAQAAVFVTAKVACERPWWLDVLASAMRFFIAAADVILSISGSLYDAAKEAVELAEWLASVADVALYAGLAFGAWWLYRTVLR